MYYLDLKSIPSIIHSITKQTLAVSAIATATTVMALPMAYADDHPIQVQTVKQAGSKVMGFKAQTVFDQPLTPIVAAMTDTTEGGRWVPKIKQIQLLDGIPGETTYTMYVVLDVPFPLQERDMVTTNTLQQIPSGQVEFISKSITSNSMPPQKGKVRMRSYKGKWTFTPIGKNQTKVEIEGGADPAGSVPAWAVNMFIEDQPREMLTALRKVVQQPRYQNASIDYITEKY